MPGLTSNPYAIAGSGLLGGLAGGLLQQPQNTNGNFSNTTSSSGTSNYTKNLSPGQSAIQAPLISYIQRLMSDPTATIAPFQNQARENVNRNYSGLADSLRSQFLSNGGGASGKFGTALVNSDLQRRGDLSTVDNTYSQAAAQLPLQASQLAEQLLGMDFSSTTNTGASGGSTGSSQQTVNQGDPARTGLGTAASIISSLLAFL